MGARAVSVLDGGIHSMVPSLRLRVTKTALTAVRVTPVEAPPANPEVLCNSSFALYSTVYGTVPVRLRVDRVSPLVVGVTPGWGWPTCEPAYSAWEAISSAERPFYTGW